MTPQTTTRLPVWARAAILAVVVMVVLGVALAAPARTRAEGEVANAQMLVFDWNKPVTIGMSGFAQLKPLSAYPQFPNDNWVSPINYTAGTLYFRAKVLSIPQNQPGMKLGFCFWQQRPKYGEECSKNQPVAGVPGNEVRWSQSFQSLAKINRAPINWTQPRAMEGFVVRNSRGKPVSRKLGMNWNGENPLKWYPLNIQFSVVLVAPGGGAPDWTQYGWSSN